MAFFLAAHVRNLFALGQPRYIETSPSKDCFTISAGGNATPVYVGTNDYVGVQRAAVDLQTDISRVSGTSPHLSHDLNSLGKNAILVGTIGKSSTIDRLAGEGKLDVSKIAGKWESFLIQVVPHPFPGITSGLVIVGSDLRGTIYGIYDLSEEIGVSPWYWLTDVPVQHHESLFAKSGQYIQGPPAVKYRGIFLNDEAPDLTGWANKTFGGYNHAFYTNIFELLLRLKANYLWPAMWNNCFGEDDPLNAKLADDYGIVLGTSHVEPMMRADKEWNRLGHTAREWNYLTHSNLLDSFWKDGLERNSGFEKIITIAMRGKIDTPMSETANIALLERIVADQRNIISEVYRTDATDVPQLWALYKEVQEYYEKGMRVPDDVTLLWCDDNWGNVRRLPTPEERARSGGSGIYYHLDYVGGPRNYKWLNTVPISKIWEQMNLAYHYGADRIWIVNVGHLQHVTFPMEFFLSLAWNPVRWPKEKLQDYTRLWAEREFGSKYAAEIADIVSKYTKYNGRRKPELLEPGTFSLDNYQEADKVEEEWEAIASEAERIYHELPQEARDAFYETVLHPTKACAVVNDLYITVAKNRLYASQRRASANDLAAEARKLFKEDAELSDYYNHKLANGKWDHMMDQTHIGYTYWQQPPKNTMPAVQEIQLPEAAEMGVAIEGSALAWPGATNEPILPTFDNFNQPRRYVDIFNKGRQPFGFSVSVSDSWVRVSQTNGTVEKDLRLWVGVDWNHAPKGSSQGRLKIGRSGGESVNIELNLFNPVEPSREALKGFVESDGYVSIEPVHYATKTDLPNARWENIDDLGRTLSSMSIFPVTAPSVNPPQASPSLQYRVYLFNSGSVDVDAMIAPSLNFVAGRGLRFAISFDGQKPQILTAVPKGYFVNNGVRDWEEAVKDNIRTVKASFNLPQPGYHTLKVWMVDPGVVLEKLVINTGGLKPSYLGPPESYHN